MIVRGISLIIASLIVITSSCKRDDDMKLFTELPPDDTGITFRNLVRETEEFNVLTYGYFHQGGGVAIGDINNDSLPDIYFTGNMMASKLYLNKGDWEFEDMTESAGVRAEGLWNTGTTMADVNGDGLLDLYVCRSAANIPDNRRNLLFINNGDLTFTEAARRYGIDDPGYSTQASFFDYDRDGDLDLFSLNHSTQEFAGFSRVTGEFKNRKNAALGSKLFRNDGERFTDVTGEAGIINNVLGFGLGVTVTDANNDQWPDIYISNDYNEEDYFYVNQKDGTFREALAKHFGHVSFFSMGADAADLNNDLRSDIITLDMLPENSYNQKKIMGPENYEKYRELIAKGFFPQTMRNMLHLNNGNGYFSEIGQLAGISNTDWSWSVLAADYDNDGWKDLMVTNGYMRNYLDMDFLSYMVSEQVNLQQSNRNVVLLELINRMPPIEVRNYFFRNNRDLTFEKTSKEWGFEKNTVSNAAAYGDLDNDGDLDLVICHTNAEASVFRNNSTTLNRNHFLKVKLHGRDRNRFGTGTKVILYTEGMPQQQEMIPVRGFQSSVNYELVFGLGAATVADSLFVVWPDSSVQVLHAVKADQTLSLRQEDAEHLKPAPRTVPVIFSEVPGALGIRFADTRSASLDFKRDRMMPNSISPSGPKLAKGDVNGDGLTDLFVVGSRESGQRLYRQRPDGSFVAAPPGALPAATASGASDAVFFDADGDGDEDLCIVGEGSGQDGNGAAAQTHLFFNDGRGHFTPAANALPEMRTNPAVLLAGDFNGDGATDLFVGGRSVPGSYPVAPRSYLLKNDGKGRFKDVTAEVCPALVNPGMVTDARFARINGDERMDLIIVGEWMEVGVFINEGNTFARKEDALKGPNAGWWLALDANDFDQDGDTDFVLGNFGKNNQYHVDARHPAKLLYKDFDGNGSVDPIFQYYIDDTLTFAYSRDELISQIPSMKKKFVNYESFARAGIDEYFSPEQLKDSDTLVADLHETVYLQNDGAGNLEVKKLPVEAQFSPVYALASADVNGDGHLDILTGGNFTQARVSVGQCDANYGVVLLGDGQGGFSTLDPVTSGLLVRGDVRDIAVVNTKVGVHVLFLRNGNTVTSYRVLGKKSAEVAASGK